MHFADFYDADVINITDNAKTTISPLMAFCFVFNCRETAKHPRPCRQLYCSKKYTFVVTVLIFPGKEVTSKNKFKTSDYKLRVILKLNGLCQFIHCELLMFVFLWIDYNLFTMPP